MTIFLFNSYSVDIKTSDGQTSSFSVSPLELLDNPNSAWIATHRGALGLARQDVRFVHGRRNDHIKLEAYDLQDADRRLADHVKAQSAGL